MILSIGTSNDPWSSALMRPVKARLIDLNPGFVFLTLGLILVYRRVKGYKKIILNNKIWQILFTIPAKIFGFKTIWLADSEKLNPILSLMLKLNSYSVNYIIAPNQSQENIYLKLGVPSQKIELIYPPCSSVNDIPRQTDKIVLACDGNLEIEQGLGVLLKAVSLAQEILGGLKVLIGGQIRGKQKIIWLASNLKLNLQLAPSPNHSWPIDAGIYVLPNVDEMPAPLSLLYAVRQGKPVIASLWPNNKEFIIPNHNGILVEPNNAEMLAQAVIDLARKPEWKNQLGENNKKFAAEKFSQNVFDAKMKKILE